MGHRHAEYCDIGKVTQWFLELSDPIPLTVKFDLILAESLKISPILVQFLLCM